MLPSIMFQLPAGLVEPGRVPMRGLAANRGRWFKNRPILRADLALLTVFMSAVASVVL
jgi:hypothetical protein